jgi:hypothetical protein
MTKSAHESFAADVSASGVTNAGGAGSGRRLQFILSSVLTGWRPSPRVPYNPDRLGVLSVSAGGTGMAADAVLFGRRGGVDVAGALGVPLGGGEGKDVAAAVLFGGGCGIDVAAPAVPSSDALATRNAARHELATCNPGAKSELGLTR